MAESNDHDRPLTREDRDLLERVAETEELGDVAQRMIEQNRFESGGDGQ
jgi:hypothetical protein